MRYPDSSKERKTTHMKHLIFAVAITSIALTGCKKTKHVVVQDQAPTVAMNDSTQAMMEVIINGEEVEMPNLPIDEIIEIAKKNGNGNVQLEAIVDMVFEDGEADWHAKDGHHVHDKAIMMKKMHMDHPHEMHKADMWVGYDGDWDKEEDNWLEREHEEEFEFMHKVALYHEVGNHLSESDAMAIFGVHMLRDNVEPELRVELLDGIIEATFDRAPGRNAALLVAIETLMEMGEEEEAARYIAELVISNSSHGHVPPKDEGHEDDGDEDHDH